MKKNSFYELISALNLPKNKLVGLSIIVILFSSLKIFLAFVYKSIFNNLEKFTLDKIYLCFGIVLGIIVFSGFMLKVYETKKRLVAEEATYCLQKKILNQKINESLILTEKENLGEWLTRISSDSKILANFYPITVLGGLKGIVPFLLAIIYGVFSSWKLTLVIIMCSLLAVLIPKNYVKKIEEKYKEKQLNDEGVRNHLANCFENVALIKSYNANSFFVEKFKKQYEEYSNCAIENAKLSAKIESVNIGIGFLMNTIWMIVGVLMILNENLKVGDFIGFMALSDCFNWPFFEMPTFVNDYAKAKASYSRLFNMRENEDCKPQAFSKEYVSDIEGYLLTDVCFGYTENHNVINGINLEIDDNILAIVGDSGKGKTTLLKLLAGLYSPSSGNLILRIKDKVLLGSEILEHVCYVSQNNYIFTDSILENIRYGKSEATNDEIYKVARLVNADDFIKKLPSGYNTIIGDNSEVKLSTGQLQRISLARGILRDADIYLLDEVTSALDGMNQQVIIENLQKINKRIIFITHNRDMLKLANRIFEV